VQQHAALKIGVECFDMDAAQIAALPQTRR
jgi:hypothetical protein